MSKKNHYPPRLAKVTDKTGDELNFPANRHVLTSPQRELPNPVAAIAEITQPSERARLRAATVSQEQREARARREVQQIIAAAEGPAPTVWEDLQATRRRPLDAPMATRIGELPDPLAQQAWDAIVADAAQTARGWWGKWSFTIALAVWSAACFLLGTRA